MTRVHMLFGTLAVLLLGGCGKQDAQPHEEIRPVRVLEVRPANGRGEVAYSGVVRARLEVPLSFRIGGKLLSRKVEVGTQVERGQPIATLDSRDVALQAQAASAQFDAAKVQLAQAELDLQRSRDLFDKKFVSQAEVDRRQTQVDALKQQLQQARSQAQLASNQSAYAQLSADVAGVVTAVTAEPGAVLAAGQPVILLAQDGARDVVFDVPEGRQRELKPGSPVTVELWAAEGRSLPATVREIAPAADPVARTYRVKVALPAGPQAPALGMSATVRVPQAEAPQAGVALPLTALLGQGKEQRVWLLGSDGKVQGLKVSVRSYRDGAVLVDGIQPGARVITAGVHLLHEGQKVRVLDERQAGVASHVQ
ncbi:efflux RND transporter periplasmic adaptor subunit [Chitinilyticum litopenaei]|uniref:efflux RND transporter periplasmic adaptor subunit n=1 Tax=Chitinilyticum litopenaei TaxID=1121276 RepID=UPI0009DBFB38|nr:efflux RND transporter periplasmic adaptor subunit [Chitinilyticum litopenaei]